MGYNSMSEEEIRAAVLKEAHKRFLSIGIANTQMNLIAKSVGISRSTLYLYFPSKVDLVFRVARELMCSISRDAAGFVAAAKCPDGFSSVHHWLLYHLEFYRANISIAHFFDEFDAIYTGDYPDIEETKLYASDMIDSMNEFYALVARGQADGSIRSDMPASMLGSALIDGLYGVIFRLLPRKAHIESEHGVNIDEVIDFVVSQLEQSAKTPQ